MINVKWIEKTQRSYNEDKYFNDENTHMIIDGASPLGTKIFNDLESDTYWLHPFIKKYLYLCNEPYKFFDTIIKDMMNDLTIDISQTFNLPSAGVAYATIKNNIVSVVTVGDCVAIVKTKSGIQTILKSPLGKLDGTAISKMVKIQQEKNLESVLKSREFVSDLIKENRNKLNEEDGYGVLAPKKLPHSFINIERFEINNVEAIALFSDGVYQYVDTLEMGDDKSLLNNIEWEGPEEIINNIFKVQNNDSTCKKYPRLKVSDDCVIALLEFK